MSRTSWYIAINKENFEKRQKEGLEENKANGGQGDSYDFHQEAIRFDELYINEEGEVDFSAITDLGYIGGTIKLTPEMEIRLIELVVKKMNKFKTVLEGLKTGD